VVAAVEVAELIAERLRVKLLCTCRVEDRVVLEGDALVKVPCRP
jgi:3-hydroxybutyryl-CoA dehydratase